MQSHIYYRKERIISTTNKILDEDHIDIISNIIGKRYESISWIHHRFFNIDGFTAVLKSKNHNYTEAFAGSGEFAVVRLVVEILGAPKKSLILLDEPEVSLHPGAQEKLVEFLKDQCRKNQHQIIFTTHSPSMIASLPHEAIKVFVTDTTTGKIQLPSQSAAPEEAFFHIGNISYEKITIFVEDILAREVIKKALRFKGEAFASQFELKSLPGGASGIWTHYIPSFVIENRKDILIVFDADKKKKLQLPNPKNYGPSAHKDLRNEIENIIGGSLKFLIDGGEDGENVEQLEKYLRKYCCWVRKNVRTLPDFGTPEEFIWKTMDKNDLSASCNASDAKAKFVELTRLELGRTPEEMVSSNDVFQTQARKLHAILDSDTHFDEIRSMLEDFVIQRND